MDFKCLQISLAFIIMCLAAAKCLPRPHEEETNNDQQQWELFKLKFNKTYKDEVEESNRLKIFIDNNKFINSHNDLYEKGLVKYKMGINQFTDLTHNEFLKNNFGYKSRLKRSAQITSKAVFTKENADVNAPKNFDWREKGAVTKVKDQKGCNSCWAFSAVGALEGQHFLKTGKLSDLSVQHLIDCDTFNDGCDGGTPENAFIFVKYNGGIHSEDAYPYTAEKKSCHLDSKELAATDEGYRTIKSDEELLKLAVASEGPISVAMDSSTRAFQFYDKGIYHDFECSSEAEDLDRNLVLVGYGTDENLEDYWILKNSFSEDWGEQGYLKIARNKGNMCGIATRAIFPIVDYDELK